MGGHPLENLLGAGPAGLTLEIAAEGKTSALRIRAWRAGGECCWMAGVPKPKKPARCEDCYFQQNMLCALNLGKPCTTFRPAERGLAPERQLAFVFRAERTTAAYAFPQPNG
jgi:hypothetical protein